MEVGQQDVQYDNSVLKTGMSDRSTNLDSSARKNLSSVKATLRRNRSIKAVPWRPPSLRSKNQDYDTSGSSEMGSTDTRQQQQQQQPRFAHPTIAAVNKARKGGKCESLVGRNSRPQSSLRCADCSPHNEHFCEPNIALARGNNGLAMGNFRLQKPPLMPYKTVTAVDEALVSGRCTSSLSSPSLRGFRHTFSQEVDAAWHEPIRARSTIGSAQHVRHAEHRCCYNDFQPPYEMCRGGHGRQKEHGSSNQPLCRQRQASTNIETSHYSHANGCRVNGILPRGNSVDSALRERKRISSFSQLPSQMPSQGDSQPENSLITMSPSQPLLSKVHRCLLPARYQSTPWSLAFAHSRSIKDDSCSRNHYMPQRSNEVCKEMREPYGAFFGLRDRGPHPPPSQTDAASSEAEKIPSLESPSLFEEPEEIICDRNGALKCYQLHHSNPNSLDWNGCVSRPLSCHEDSPSAELSVSSQASSRCQKVNIVKSRAHNASRKRRLNALFSSDNQMSTGANLSIPRTGDPALTVGANYFEDRTQHAAIDGSHHRVDQCEMRQQTRLCSSNGLSIAAPHYIDFCCIPNDGSHIKETSTSPSSHTISHALKKPRAGNADLLICAQAPKNIRNEDAVLLLRDLVSRTAVLYHTQNNLLRQLRRSISLLMEGGGSKGIDPATCHHVDDIRRALEQLKDEAFPASLKRLFECNFAPSDDGQVREDSSQSPSAIVDNSTPASSSVTQRTGPGHNCNGHGDQLQSLSARLLPPALDRAPLPPSRRHHHQSATYSATYSSPISGGLHDGCNDVLGSPEKLVTGHHLSTISSNHGIRMSPIAACASCRVATPMRGLQTKNRSCKTDCCVAAAENQGKCCENNSKQPQHYNQIHPIWTRKHSGTQPSQISSVLQHGSDESCRTVEGSRIRCPVHGSYARPRIWPPRRPECREAAPVDYGNLCRSDSNRHNEPSQFQASIPPQSPLTNKDVTSDPRATVHSHVYGTCENNQRSKSSCVKQQSKKCRICTCNEQSACPRSPSHSSNRAIAAEFAKRTEHHLNKRGAGQTNSLPKQDRRKSATHKRTQSSHHNDFLSFPFSLNDSYCSNSHNSNDGCVADQQRLRCIEKTVISSSCQKHQSTSPERVYKEDSTDSLTKSRSAHFLRSSKMGNGARNEVESAAAIALETLSAALIKSDTGAAGTSIKHQKLAAKLRTVLRTALGPITNSDCASVTVSKNSDASRDAKKYDASDHPSEYTAVEQQTTTATVGNAESSLRLNRQNYVPHEEDFDEGYEAGPEGSSPIPQSHSAKTRRPDEPRNISENADIPHIRASFRFDHERDNVATADFKYKNTIKNEQRIDSRARGSMNSKLMMSNHLSANGETRKVTETASDSAADDSIPSFRANGEEGGSREEIINKPASSEPWSLSKSTNSAGFILPKNDSHCRTNTKEDSRLNCRQNNMSRPVIPLLGLKERRVGSGAWLSGAATQGDTYAL